MLETTLRVQIWLIAIHKETDKAIYKHISLSVTVCLFNCTSSTQLYAHTIYAIDDTRKRRNYIHTNNGKN